MTKINSLSEWSERLSASIDENEIFGVVVLDRQGIIQYWNRGAELLTQFTRPEAVGQNVGLFFTPLDREHSVPQEEMKQALQVGKAEDERYHLRRDSSVFWAVGAMTSVLNSEGEAIGFVKLFRDDSARHKTELEIHTSIANLNTFAHTAAHDLRQPLRTVSNYIQLVLRQAPLDTASREHLSVALDATKRMNDLTSDLLALAEAGPKSTSGDIVDCNTACDLAVENLAFAIEETKGVVHRGALPELRGFPTQICQVFQNLIGNGLKYRDPAHQPFIYVAAVKVPEGWKFSVTDNGLGIAEENRERIFKAFERIHNPYCTSGSGLGLAIVKKIVEAHGGKVWVESNPGQGTTFFFTIAA